MTSTHPPSSPVSGLGSPSAPDDRVREAMERFPRSMFLPPSTQAPGSSAGVCLPAGIPAPEPLLETMLKALELGGTERVLEIGSSSAYETALLSCLASEVVSLDVSPESAQARLRLLASLGCHNVRVFLGHGQAGWAGEGPYQAILVAAGATRLPQPLLDQLDFEGRLVIPLGDSSGQVVELVRKRLDGVTSQALGTSYLPMLPGATRRPSTFPWNRSAQ